MEVIPDPHGSFGDWLGYWGNIIGGIIGAIVAAAVSYFVTTVTFSKLNHQRAIDENKFQVQVNLRTELLK
ncbi:hypothetical protein FD25_GL000188 [Levilactobacillus acidifarinae DSM 19394]|uniref:Uncharacterized protein n=1 Tax=Levilactobacillus acidifarinae DSM 19394 = JCM 15949 TaxID=1423715 RepID=A0A0R1LEK2_9LACO|nr:hypothetical protein FD25_GL000188 [Levilactobacillus acidifarinae DSM 19394]